MSHISSNRSSAKSSQSQPAPLRRAHSHNDYYREEPLTEALQRGFTSVEADIFLMDGELRVGHTEEEAREGPTLEDLYLRPLEHRIEEKGGAVFEDGTPLNLLIDVKSAPLETYQVLREELKTYEHILTEYNSGEVLQDPIQVILSGRVARQEIESQEHRYLAIDGGRADLENDSSDDLVPLVSQAWQEHFWWHGGFPMPRSQRKKLHDLVDKAHDEGKKIRFWGAPDREDIWREELAAGVDYLTADDLGKLEKFFRKKHFDPSP